MLMLNLAELWLMVLVCTKTSLTRSQSAGGMVLSSLGGRPPPPNASLPAEPSSPTSLSRWGPAPALGSSLLR